MDPDSGPVPLPPLLSRTFGITPQPRLPWRTRLRHNLPHYLPVLLMALLAAATAWLVRSTPVPEPDRAAAAPSQEPDYQMRGFSVQRYASTGPAQGVIEGELARHYATDDRLEIDGVRVRWTATDGRTLHAHADHAVAHAPGQRVRLEGGAQVRREPGTTEPAALEFLGEQIDFDLATGHVHSDKPVQLRQGASVIDAGSLDHDNAQQTTVLGSGVQGVVQNPAKPGVRR